jgi:peptide/nickel transport system permease protein
MLYRSKGALISVFLLAFILVVTVAGLVFLRGDAATATSFSGTMIPPFSLAHGFRDFLGTDLLGRSELFRLIVAARTSLAVAFSAAFLAAGLGAALGIIAGFRRGLADTIIMRLSDAVQSFPSLFLAVLFLYILEPRVENIIILLVVGRLPMFIRVARAETLTVVNSLFVDAARCLGASSWWLCVYEIAPVILPTMLTLAALEIGVLMLVESSLSFLGVGIQPPGVSWGIMVSEGRDWIQSAWWLTLLPGLCIATVSISCNVLSNWLRLVMNPVERWRLDTDVRVADAVLPAALPGL